MLSDLITDNYNNTHIKDAFMEDEMIKIQKTESEWEELVAKYGTDLTNLFSDSKMFNEALDEQNPDCLKFIGFECDSNGTKYRFIKKTSNFTLDKYPLIVSFHVLTQ